MIFLENYLLFMKTANRKVSTVTVLSNESINYFCFCLRNPYRIIRTSGGGGGGGLRHDKNLRECVRIAVYTPR